MNQPTEITLFVPSGCESCADWLKEQSPQVVCQALSLAESALCAIERQKESGDSARLVEEIQELKREHAAALRLERATRDEREQLLQNEAQAKDSALRANNANELEKLAEELGKHSEQKRCIIESEMAKLLEDRSAQQRRHEDEAAAIRSACGRESERKEEEHTRDLAALREELRKREGEESIKAAELARRYEDARRQDTLSQAENAKHMQALHDREILLLREMCDKATTREEGYLTNMREIEHTNKQLLADCTAKMENVLTRSTTAVGQYGERLVSEVFAELNLGELSDDRGVQTEGYADATWSYEAPGTPFKIQALVEVKQVSSVLHSVKDLEKYDRDVRAAVMAGRINCAILLSLSARVPGRRQFDLDTISGILVLRASRSADDALPPDALIRLAFTTMATSWPFLCRGREEGSIEASIEAVAEHLDAQLLEFDKLSKRAASIKKMGKQLEREALELEKIRSRLLSGVEALRLNNPSLIPSLEGPSGAREDPGEVAAIAVDATPAAMWECMGGASLLDAFRSWRQERGGGTRWPARLDQMELSAEASAFAAATPNAFVLGRDKVKDEIQKTKRRRTAEPGAG
jgi:hypothetical protein